MRIRFNNENERTGMQMKLRVLALAILLGLTAPPAFAQSSKDANADLARIAMLDGADRQKVLEDGARREGSVVWYCSLTENTVLRPLAQAFAKKYPFVKIDYWRGGSAQIIQKVTAELQARNPVVDVIEGSGTAVPLIKAKAIVPFTSPHIADYQEIYRDPRHLWAATRFAYYGLGYNTREVSKADVPKTYEALLDPQWKGRMAWRVGDATGAELFITAARLAMGEDKADAYFARLSGQNIVPYTSSARSLVNQVIAGEYAMGLNIFLHHPIYSALQGAPSASQAIEPVPSTIGTIQLSRGARHPHAAMLLIDFVLSPDGQQVMAREDYLPGNSKVEPSDAQKAIVPRYAGTKEAFVSPEVLEEMHRGSADILKKYFK
jgi:iron(III) transport system substrate-binding protein